ncbi:alpha/beta fold hydrolase [Micromonospora siamensis]|uniref:Pimeloyl-ACP methyl ester carboxylesterase n=1 Tax=Micromonospora siamensis TaxID=299152 RepID=A0A1C5H8C2_9ACTN|nr:alpha/beta hydrolase [Micromonospora siamensis]SCG42268.1 Pimeloyl-ACP methyl ester carboxylesterase [Micromonospora siamensis]
MPRLTDQSLDLPSGRTHYRLDGPPGGPVVILIPGATLPMFVWDGLAEPLIDAGYRVVRYDLLGRGASASPRVTYGADLYHRQLAELLQRLAVARPVHLVALAFGTIIAADFADRHPERLASLTYIAPDGFGVHTTRFHRLMNLPGVGELLLHAAGTKILLSRLPRYSHRTDVIDALRDKFRPYASAPGFQRAVLSSIRRMPIQDATSLYARVSGRGIPTLVLWGREDRIAPLPEDTTLRKSLPGAEIQVLDQTGHLPHVEREIETAALLTNFLTQTTEHRS